MKINCIYNANVQVESSPIPSIKNNFKYNRVVVQAYDAQTIIDYTDVHPAKLRLQSYKQKCR